MVVFEILLMASLVSQPKDAGHVTGSGLFGGAVDKGKQIEVQALYPGGKTLCCFGPEAYRRYLKALRARDEAGVAEVVKEGQAVPLDEGTAVRVLESHDQGFETYRGVDALTGQNTIRSIRVGELIPVSASEVRILTGPHKGKSGWIPSDLHSGTIPVNYRAGSRVLIGMANRQTGRIDPDSKISVASDLKAYDEYWFQHKVGGSASDYGDLTRSRRIIDIPGGTQVSVVAVHERKPNVLTEPAVEVKFLSGSLKGKSAFVHPAEVVWSIRGRRR
jgi:hypothetical protein